MPAVLAGAVAESARDVRCGYDREDTVRGLVNCLWREPAYLEALVTAHMSEALDLALALLDAGDDA